MKKVTDDHILNYMGKLGVRSATVTPGIRAQFLSNIEFRAGLRRDEVVFRAAFFDRLPESVHHLFLGDEAAAPVSAPEPVKAAEPVKPVETVEPEPEPVKAAEPVKPVETVEPEPEPVEPEAEATEPEAKPAAEPVVNKKAKK